tara:strand:- start:25 stop:360 length:336 start_codon:yes stop_codon:yes gene_type:complete
MKKLTKVITVYLSMFLVLMLGLIIFLGYRFFIVDGMTGLLPVLAFSSYILMFFGAVLAIYDFAKAYDNMLLAYAKKGKPVWTIKLAYLKIFRGWVVVFMGIGLLFLVIRLG